MLCEEKMHLELHRESMRLQSCGEKFGKKMHNAFDDSGCCTTITARSPETRVPKRRKRRAKRSEFSAQRRLIFQRTNSENSSRNAAKFIEKTKAKLCAARYEARRLIGKTIRRQFGWHFCQHIIFGEFDSGSERTLAAWIRHASRTGHFR